MAEINDTSPPSQWKEGAKALYNFQQAAYAAGKTGRAQGRAFSSLKDICKTIKEASDGTGLSHTERWAVTPNSDSAFLTVTLHHTSGESISSSIPVDITQKNRSGSREQAQGSAMTYARRYLLLGLYGLANDDEDDDGEATTSAPSQVAKPPAPTPVHTEETSPPAKVFTDKMRDECVAIIKEHPDVKHAFKAKFFKDAIELYPQMIDCVEHYDFIISNKPS